jgi:hypothetical protein
MHIVVMTVFWWCLLVALGIKQLQSNHGIPIRLLNALQ